MPIVQERGLTGETMLLATAWIAIVDIASIVALPLALDPVARRCGSPAAACWSRWPRSLIFAIIHASRDEPVVSTLRSGLAQTRVGARPALFAAAALFGLAALATKFGTSILIAGFARRDDRGARR